MIRLEVGPDTIGVEEEEEEVTGDGSEKVIEYDEIDSSKTVEEEITDLMAGGAVDDLEEDEVCVRTNLEQYIGYEFSSQTTTNSWMKWDTKGSH